MFRHDFLGVMSFSLCLHVWRTSSPICKVAQSETNVSTERCLILVGVVEIGNRKWQMVACSRKLVIALYNNNNFSSVSDHSWTKKLFGRLSICRTAYCLNCQESRWEFSLKCNGDLVVFSYKLNTKITDWEMAEQNNFPASSYKHKLNTKITDWEMADQHNFPAFSYKHLKPNVICNVMILVSINYYFAGTYQRSGGG